MNATTPQATLPEDLAQVADGKTLEILERRGASSRHRRGWLVRRTLVIADLVGLALAFLLAELVLGEGGPHSRLDPAAEYLLFVCTLPGWLFVAKLYGLYDNDEERTDHTTVDEFVGVFHLVTIGAWLFFAGSWLTGLIVPDLKKLVMFWGLAIAFVVTARALGRAFCRRRLTYLQNTVIVGAGDVGQLVARKLSHHPEYGINLVGFVDIHPKEARRDLGELRVLGGPDALRRSSVASTSSVSSWRSRQSATRKLSMSCARSRRSTSRSTSSRASSRRWGPGSGSMRSRECRSWACRRRGLLSPRC